MDEETVAATLIRRATRLKRRLTTGTIFASVLTSFVITWAYVGDPTPERMRLSGRNIGTATGAILAASFLCCVGLGLFLGRLWLRGQVRGWVREARRAHGLEEGTMEYVVSMFGDPPPKRTFEDD